MSDVLRELMARELVAARLGEAAIATDDVAPGASPAERTRLWLLQLLLPDLVAALESIIVDAGRKQHHVRRLAGGLLTYVYNPLDLIGDDTPLGRVDDTIICALGLARLREREHIELSPGVSAICALAESELPLLAPELQTDIRSFIRDLDQAT